MSKELFLDQKKWAVIGDVLNPTKYASRIWRHLQTAGYDVSAVHPLGGQSVSTSLTSLEQVPEVICLVINPVVAPEYLRQAKDLGITKVWIQPGADTPEILELCKSLGLDFVQACILVELG